jgi:transposase
MYLETVDWATSNPSISSSPWIRGVAARAGVIEIEFATGGRMRITGTVDAPTVTVLMKALAKGKRRR